MSFNDWPLLFTRSWQHVNRNHSTKTSLPQNMPILNHKVPERGKPTTTLRSPPTSWWPSQLKPRVLLAESSEPGLCWTGTSSSSASPDWQTRQYLWFSPCEAQLHIVTELSLCFLFDKINWLSLCILSNQKDHHDQLPVQDKVEQFSALIPGTAVVWFATPAPGDHQSPQQSCSKSELGFWFVLSFSL